MSDFAIRRLHKALTGHYPLVYVLTSEERRLESTLASLSREHFGDERPIVTWSTTRGFIAAGQVDAAILEPLEALRHVAAASARDCFYLFKDLPLLLDGQPALTRALRDLYTDLAKRETWLFMSSATLQLPESLARQVFTVNIGLPDEAEIREELTRFCSSPAFKTPLAETWLDQAVSGMKGMTLDEIRHLMLRLVSENRLSPAATLEEAHEEKAAALLREGCLKFMPRTVDIDHIGGLDNLKDWVLSRKRFFDGSTVAPDALLPSGVLFMGVSGCGKSMAAKVIASAWNLPLVRLDMNLVLSGAHGTPEYAFDHALRVVEQIAPLTLWIDEMENSFGYDTGVATGNSNIFSSFLTWMQEKPAGVFVVATANRIEKLPAEVIRKGRFDQLFFLDLPTDDERRTILGIHIAEAGGEPAQFNLTMLSAVTKNWSGAEIEQAVKAAVVRAWQEERPFNERDVLWSATHMVPLARTMEEQIKQLRIWSQDRATPASRKSPA